MEGSSPHARSASRELETRTNASTTPKSTRIKRAFQEIDELEEKYNSEKERSDGLLKKPALPPLVIPDFRLQSSLTTVQTLRVSSPSLSTREDSAGPVSDSAAKIISAPRHFSPDMSLKVELLQKLMEQASDQRYHQSRGIVELVGHLREDVQSLPEVLGKLIGTVDAGDSNSSVHLVETLHAIESRLIETLANSEKAQSVTVTQQADETRAKIDSVMADVLQRLTILQGFATRTSVQDADNGMMTMKDLPEPPAAGVDANNITGTNHDARHDLTGIRDKLDNLLELVKTKCTASETERGQASGAPEAISSDNLPGPCGEQRIAPRNPGSFEGRG
ncbi:hypothetical protein CONPUDRAFT_81071 [Coniophora puteana RWD-64-598 SS2]|uniref:Uncharacterized protein n=1 Tax=Coniophora puteana (strain RWD-64-598) TaxID=741705 RepID=A0A5M3MV71_CONPW|nr:uncharacterized protein CONPUDRAFT_81071 [Coniophora puteana RWD-64-598 SS2]EIW82907.1 hypothetical protein CONPUDRAFT_81071 [Coniophora puteana RWD-64-598 SS2]